MSEYPGMIRHQKELLLEYGTKLDGIDKDFIKDIFFPTLEQIQQICEEKVAPHVMEWDEIGVKYENGKAVFPPGVMDAFNTFVRDQNGPRLYEALIPEEYGGAGFPSLMLGPLMEIIGYYDMALTVTLGLGATLIEALAMYPDNGKAEKYFPLLREGKVGGFVAFTEPNAGSNLKNVKTTSTLDGDNFIVKGQKIFISNAGFGELGIVLTRYVVDGKEQGTNAFVVETSFPDADDDSKPGIRCTRLEEKLGIHASATGVLEFNCRVPKENLLGTLGEGYQKVLERLLGMRMGVAFQSTALAERAYQMAKEYANQRVQFGKPIISFPGVANKIKGMEIALLKMRRFAFEGAYAISRYQRRQSIKAKHLANINEQSKKALEQFGDLYQQSLIFHVISKAKMYNSEVGWIIVDDALQIFGGNGYIRDYEIERILRDFRVLRIYEGTSEIHEILINRTKKIATISDPSKLISVAMSSGSVKAAMPEFKPLDYEAIFLQRFPSVKDVFRPEDQEDPYLFSDPNV